MNERSIVIMFVVFCIGVLVFDSYSSRQQSIDCVKNGGTWIIGRCTKK